MQPFFDIRNNFPYTVWAGAVPGGGQQLNPGQTWSLNVAAGTSQARIWPRTNCNFDGSGRGNCGPTYFQDFSKIDAPMPIATPRMIKLARLHALVEQTIGLCFALPTLFKI
ncbi:unnamed protein product [Lactuca virosa]|uniref:Neprosin domain-containing protein n=1 Tax=Lactuca virosa TaxID=75947 RepID=A0AAU9LGU0_9ASTR|nr:unnamed protein product [Lactuca virosa]